MKKAYVISVSLGQGCYRHVEIPQQNTLHDLHEAIQYAFHFDNDHPYAFFMNNHVWDDTEAYYSPYMTDEEGVRSAEIKLSKLNLSPNKKFIYLFDFGDEWTFQCKVLRETKTDNIYIIRSVGTVPEQYPDYDES